jgi:hypothetical protein
MFDIGGEFAGGDLLSAGETYFADTIVGTVFDVLAVVFAVS